ncbi:MAG: glycosyltransferase family 39 protein [Bacteroidales bacterium]|nr:glycosyltransferase family 39 protein [Bacteroidales bacterium]
MISMHNNRPGLYQALIAALAALLFMPFLGEVNLFDWDEINFAESAREMISSGDYLTVQINFIPFWEKPPLFIWMQALSMKIFGVGEFAARFPNALCGIVTLLVLFNIGRRLKDTTFGLLWTLLYAGSVLPFLYFKSGIIDPWFNLFIFLGTYQMYRYFSDAGSKFQYAVLSGLFIGLAILTKGPVALLLFAITTGIVLVINKFRIAIRFRDVMAFTLVLAFTGGFWFILQMLSGNYSIIVDFIEYQIRLFRTKDAGHGGFLLYHLVILLIGVFPASLFALPSLIGLPRKKESPDEFRKWMMILFWVVLVVFTIVKTKIVHYSSLCYFPLTFLAAWSVYHWNSLSAKWRKTIILLVVFMGAILAVGTIGITYIEKYKAWLISRGWVSDPFAIGCLEADAGWKGYEFAAGVLLLAGIAAFAFFSRKGSMLKPTLVITATLPLFMFLAMYLIVPRIEAYSQRAAIDFFRSVSREDAYLETIGYKSYAHLFYGRIRNHTHEKARDKSWLLTGDIDKPAYFSVKISRKEKFIKEFPHIEYMYEENGFVFFSRKPGIQP